MDDITREHLRSLAAHYRTLAREQEARASRSDHPDTYTMRLGMSTAFTKAAEIIDDILKAADQP